MGFRVYFLRLRVSLFGRWGVGFWGFRVQDFGVSGCRVWGSRACFAFVGVLGCMVSWLWDIGID